MGMRGSVPPPELRRQQGVRGGELRPWESGRPVGFFRVLLGMGNGLEIKNPINWQCRLVLDISDFLFIYTSVLGLSQECKQDAIPTWMISAV